VALRDTPSNESRNNSHWICHLGAISQRLVQSPKPMRMRQDGSGDAVNREPKSCLPIRRVSKYRRPWDNGISRPSFAGARVTLVAATTARVRSIRKTSSSISHGDERAVMLIVCRRGTIYIFLSPVFLRRRLRSAATRLGRSYSRARCKRFSARYPRVKGQNQSSRLRSRSRAYLADQLSQASARW